MKRDLVFLKDFRTSRQHDAELRSLASNCDEDFKEEINGIKNRPGVYIIVSDKTRFIYPKYTSKVIYIGQSVDVRARLREHRCCYKNSAKEKNVKDSEFWRNHRYKYMKHHGAYVYIYYTSGNQDAKNYNLR